MTVVNTNNQQIIQAVVDVDAILKLAKKADSRLERRREDIQRAGALWYLSRRRGLGITLHDIYSVYGVNYRSMISAAKQIKRAVEIGARKWQKRARTESPKGDVHE